jgi:hypothetical protein
MPGLAAYAALGVLGGIGTGIRQRAETLAAEALREDILAEHRADRAQDRAWDVADRDLLRSNQVSDDETARKRRQAGLDALERIPTPGSRGLGGTDASNPHFSEGVSATRYDQLFASTEKEFRLPAGYLARTAQIESGGDASAQNPNSSAGGLFQFTDGTAGQYGLGDKNDPEASTRAAAQLAADNAGVLRKSLGREPTAAELYLAHQQGAGGAVALLSNPDAKASEIVGAAAVNNNGGNANMTAMEFANQWLDKFGGGQKTDPADDPYIQGLLDVLQTSGDDLDEGTKAAIKAKIEMRMNTLAGGKGLTAYEAAQLGQKDYEKQNPKASQTDKFVGEDGFYYARNGDGVAEKILGTKGKPIRAPKKAGEDDTPSDAMMLLDKALSGDLEDGEVVDPGVRSKAMAEVNRLMDDGMSEDEAVAQVIERLDRPDVTTDAGGNALTRLLGTAPKTPDATVKGAAKAVKPDQRQTYPDAPRAASDRVVGTVYTAPDGRTVKWTGHGWQLIGG